MDRDNNAICGVCLRVFHYQWDTRAAVRDCGIAAIDDIDCALVFTCNTCVAAQQPGEGPTPGLPVP